MVTAEEIRARVEAADQARIQARAKAAAQIAEDIERRAKLRAELAEIDAAITAGLAETSNIMTLNELSAFIGIPVNELAPAAPRVNGRHGRQPRRKAVGTRKSRPALIAPAETAPIAVSSDY